MPDLQHFRAKLECEHFHEISAVREHQGKPYKPNYKGQDMPHCDGGQGCPGPFTVVSVQKIPKLGYIPKKGKK